jgi:hypothetical protein
VVIVANTALQSLFAISCRAPRPQPKARTRRSVRMIVVTAWALVGVAGCWLVLSEASQSNPAHAPYASVSSEFAVNADHSDADCTVSPACPQGFATAVLPLSAAALVTLGSAVAVTFVVGSGTHYASLGRRGPPRGVPVALTGRDILTRLCLARR